MIDTESIAQAYRLLEGVCQRTPVLRNRHFDELAGAPLYFKMESFQRSGSFKFRGAFTAIVRKLDTARERGVITASSGNHGGAVASAARMLGVRALIVMPEDAVPVKISAIKDTGAEIRFAGVSSEERQREADQLREETGMISIPPYDHEDVMSGQGTVALEALQQVPDMEVFLAPCGGGGLLAGCAAFLAGSDSSVAVYGVEPSAADDTRCSFEAQERVSIEHPDTLADGARNLIPGELSFPLVQRYCRGILTVEEEEITRALTLMLTRMKVVVEPTGALAPAAAIGDQIALDGRPTVVVVSGGNVDPALLGRLTSL